MNETKETQKEQIKQDTLDHQSNKKLPMNWYNFFTNSLIPLGIAISVLGILISILKTPLITIFFLCWIIFSMFLRNKMIKKEKNSYFYITLFFIINTIILFACAVYEKQDNLYILIAFICNSIWFCFNYIYFIKRKYLFDLEYNGQELPMHWYDFYMNVRLPLGIAITGGIATTIIINYLSSLSFNDYFSLASIFVGALCIIALFVIINIFPFILIEMMDKKRKYTFGFLVINLLAESIMITGTILPTNYLGYIRAMIALIWLIINISYFYKRKDIFIN